MKRLFIDFQGTIYEKGGAELMIKFKYIFNNFEYLKDVKLININHKNYDFVEYLSVECRKNERLNFVISE